jgi:hypothetical protein
MNFLLFGKRPSKNTVRKAAEHLMGIYGTTTTLEVKKYLRVIGYGAFQTDISDKMDALYPLCGWEFTCAGEFRVYSKIQAKQYSLAKHVLAFSAN